MTKEYTVFASHRWDYNQDLIDMKNLIERQSNVKITYSESSFTTPINSENSVYIKVRLKNKIINSHVVLAIASVYATNSEWMEWELETAQKNNIPIIGVIPRGAERISSLVDRYSIINVGWNSNSIIEAIKKYSK